MEGAPPPPGSGPQSPAPGDPSRPPVPQAGLTPPGAPPQPGWGAPPAPKKENVLGIVGLVCSILGALGLLAIVVTLGFFFFIGFISLPLSIAGMICGRLGAQKVDRGELPTGRGISQAAFVVGLVGLILHVLTAIVVVVILGLLLGALDSLEIPDRDGPKRFDEPDLQSSLLTSPTLALAWLEARSGRRIWRRGGA